MRTLLAIICLICVFANTMAKTSRNAMASDSVLAYVDTPVRSADFNLRTDAKEWALLINCTDNLNYNEFRLKHKSQSYDDVYKYVSELSFINVKDGCATTVFKRLVNHQDAMASIRLCINGQNIRIFAGDGQPLDKYDNGINFALTKNSRILLRRYTPMRQIEFFIQILPYVSLGIHDVDSCRNLASAANLSRLSGPRPDKDAYGISSPNDISGYWEYLDCDIDEPSTLMGGSYKFYIVKTDDTHFDVVYLRGAEKYAGLWQPGMTKARLTCTTIPGNFDMQWISADRSYIYDTEVSANVDANTGLIEFFFPLLDSRMRFRRSMNTH